MATKNFDVPLKNLDGTDVIDQEEGPNKGKTLSLNRLIVQALENDPALNLNYNDKVYRFTLAQKIQKGGDIELIVEDLKTIKDVVSAHFKPLVVGRVNEIIEGK
jgi:hypothetical protein